MGGTNVEPIPHRAGSGPDCRAGLRYEIFHASTEKENRLAISTIRASVWSILYGPGHVTLDTSLSKRSAVVGRSNLEFRWDVFNLFNHPGFGCPNSAIGNATAGRITTTIVDNRSMQFALKLNF
jgi:hypothetical protein